MDEIGAAMRGVGLEGGARMFDGAARTWEHVGSTEMCVCDRRTELIFAAAKSRSSARASSSGHGARRSRLLRPEGTDETESVARSSPHPHETKQRRQTAAPEHSDDE